MAAALAPLPEPRPRRGGRAAWAAEVGPYSSETAALASLADIVDGNFAKEEAAGFRVRRSAGGNPVYSLHLAGLSQHGAARVCGTLSARDLPCRLVEEGR